MNTVEKEKDKYRRMWEVSHYKETSPGLLLSELFVEISNCKSGESLIDLGCGEGVAGKFFRDYKNLDVEFLDLVRVLSEEVDNGSVKFWETALWYHDWILPNKRKYAYCCDVLEHIPTEYTMLCLSNIIRSSEYSFLNISTTDDHMGRFIGESLHLTVKPYEWWKERVEEFGEIIDARDFVNAAIFYVKGNK